jgi:hypothetical protein
MTERKIIIIGSKGHHRADCSDWQDQFPNIEEYDSVILNLQSLNQKILDTFYLKIAGMRESIKTIWETKREIFCIMDSQIFLSPTREVYPKSGKGFVVLTDPNIIYKYSNYSWLPFGINLYTNKRGTYIEICDKRFEKYLNLVKEWKFTFDIPIPNETFSALVALLTPITPIALNKSKKVIAGSIKRVNIYGKLIPEIGAIHLLPPPPDSKLLKATEEIIDIVLGAETKTILPWRETIEIPNEKNFKQRIEAKREKIAKIQTEIMQLQDEIQKRDSYRDLLTESGESLEIIVQRTLAEIGIKTKRTEKGFPTDLMSEELAIEITGIKGCVSASSEKVNQVARFRELDKNKKIVLIANTHVDLSPKEREGRMNFSPEVAKFFEAIFVCYFTTFTLLNLWINLIQGKIEKDQIKKKILSKTGELTLRDFE